MEDTFAPLDPASRFFETYETRRLFPRVKLKQPALIVKGDEKTPALFYNISPDGAQLRVEREHAGILNPSGKPIDAANGPRAHIECRLPLGGRTATLRLSGNLYYFAIVPGNKVAFGLRFDHEDERTMGSVDQFFQEHLNPTG